MGWRIMARIPFSAMKSTCTGQFGQEQLQRCMSCVCEPMSPTSVPELMALVPMALVPVPCASLYASKVELGIAKWDDERDQISSEAIACTRASSSLVLFLSRQCGAGS